jgi:photosystem II stability/assembly factor-like uncharacterized protein
MINEPNSHNHHQQHEELETDTFLPLEFEALAARLAADGAVWQSRLPDAARVAERIRAIPHDSLHESLRTASEGSLAILEETNNPPENSRRAPRPDDRRRARSSAWGRFLGLAAAAIVVALLATVLVQLANRRTTGPAEPKATSQTQATATTVAATATPTHPAGPVVTAPIVGSTMFSATTGWGSVQTGSNPNIVGRIAYTVDGGHTWYDVTPSGLTLESQGTIALYPMSATDAWTWLSVYAGGSSTTLWHTTDAGAHWSSSTVATGAVGQLNFIDSQHGWLTATPGGAAAGEYPIDVWRTIDGGATWAKVAPYSVFGSTRGISFANATTGFAGGCPLGGPSGSPINLCVTHDGGSTWSAVPSPTPPGYVNGSQLGAELPVFTSATAGVLEVTSLSNPSSTAILYLYRTTDAGTSWQLGPNLSVSVTSVPSSVLSTGEVLVAPTVSGQVTLYQWPLGATSWTKINTGSSSTALLGGITQLDFVNQTTGWAVTQAGLIGTTDGGVTWTLLHV